MRATVPEGSLPGHSFLVRFTPEAAGAQVGQDLVLSAENETKSNDSHSLVHQDSVTPDGRELVTIPYGSKPGEKIRIRHEDGRIIETTIPKDLPAGVTQFYVKTPHADHTNWHDNPLV